MTSKPKAPFLTVWLKRSLQVGVAVAKPPIGSGAKIFGDGFSV